MHRILSRSLITQSRRCYSKSRPLFSTPTTEKPRRPEAPFHSITAPGTSSIRPTYTKGWFRRIPHEDTFNQQRYEQTEQLLARLAVNPKQSATLLDGKNANKPSDDAIQALKNLTITPQAKAKEHATPEDLRVFEQVFDAFLWLPTSEGGWSQAGQMTKEKYKTMLWKNLLSKSHIASFTGSHVALARRLGIHNTPEFKELHHRDVWAPRIELRDYVANLASGKTSMATETKFSQPWDHETIRMIYGVDDVTMYLNPTSKLLKYKRKWVDGTLQADPFRPFVIGTVSFNLYYFGRWDMFNHPSDPNSTYHLQYNPVLGGFEKKRILVDSI
eukprot:UN02487